MVSDITLDEVLLAYLNHGEKPDSYNELARVMEVSNYVTLDERGTLWVTGEAKGPPR